MTVNTKRSNVPHIHTTSTPESQLSIRFALRPAVGHTEASAPNDRKMTYTKRSKVPNMHIITASRPKFHFTSPFAKY